MMDALGNFQYTIWGFLIVGGFYILIVFHRPHAERTKEVLLSTLKGFGVEAIFWFALGFIASQLAMQDLMLWNVFMHVVESPFLPISLVNISTLLIPPVFTVNEYSNGQVDYRKHVLIGLCVFTAFIWLYYWNSFT